MFINKCNCVWLAFKKKCWRLHLGYFTSKKILRELDQCFYLFSVSNVQTGMPQLETAFLTEIGLPNARLAYNGCVFEFAYIAKPYSFYLPLLIVWNDSMRPNTRFLAQARETSSVLCFQRVFEVHKIHFFK